MIRFLALACAVGLTAASASASGTVAQPGDYYPPDVLDKPLGIERLPNGNTLIADAGGANYTTTDSAVLEVDPAGRVVWVYRGDLRFAHTARPTQDGNVLITDTSNNVVIELNREGETVWSSDAWGGGTGALSDGSHLNYPNNAEELANGNLLITDRNNDRVVEVARDGEVMWQYDRLLRPHNAHRLPNGNTLVSDSEQNRIVEIDPTGEIVWSFGGGPALNWPRNGDRLANGHTLVTDSRGGRVLEVDPAGQTVWQYDGLALPFEAHRLDNGHTLIADNNHRRVIEVAPDGRIVWEFRNFVETIHPAVVNGDFEEDADGDGLPDGWYAADLNAEGIGTFIWDGVDRASGQRSASLDYHAGGRLAWLQTVRAEPGQTYHFEGWIKGQIESGNFGYQLWFVDAWGGPLGDSPIVAAPHLRSTGWTLDAVDVTAPGDAAGLQIWIASHADGRVWADAVSLSPVAPASFGASSPAWLAPVALIALGAGLVAGTRRRHQSARRRAGWSP